MADNIVQLRSEGPLDAAIATYVAALRTTNLLKDAEVEEGIKPLYEDVIRLARLNGLDGVTIRDECMTTFLDEKREQREKAKRIQEGQAGKDANLEGNIIKMTEAPYMPPTHPAKKIS